MGANESKLPDASANPGTVADWYVIQGGKEAGATKSRSHGFEHFSRGFVA
jgi:hypothetical protein